MNTLKAIFYSSLLLLAFMDFSVAHHSFAFEFDLNKNDTLEVEVRKFEYNEEIIQRVLSRQKKAVERYNDELETYKKTKVDPRAFLILDDCLYDSSWTKSKHVRSIFMNGRHFKLMFIAGNVENPSEKLRVQTLQREAYLKAMPYLQPPSERISITFEDIEFPGNLRLPLNFNSNPLPCVLLNAGADSTKEEFFTLENEYLRRGLATCAYDGPGQGMTWQQMKLRPDFESPVGAVLDYLETRPELDKNKFGIWGRSMGGYAAPRVAAHDKRIKACIALGG